MRSDTWLAPIAVWLTPSATSLARGARAAGSLLLGALLLGSVPLVPIATSTSWAATCGVGYGDVNGDEVVDITDVTCAAQVVLASFFPGAALPECLSGNIGVADLDGDEYVSVTDVHAIISLVLASAFPFEVDANQNGCLDSLELVCGDAVCSAELGETCGSCELDCGTCADPCCEPHEGSGCGEADVEACVCAISSFCCEFFWDESCTQTALEFCEPECGGPACAVTKKVACGTLTAGSTASGATSIDSYSCGGAAVGPERVYAFQAKSDTGFQAKLTAASGSDVGLRVLTGECDPTTCVGGGPGSTSATVQTTAGTTYYLAVDGTSAEGGAFDLQIDCADDCDVEALCGAKVCGPVGCAGFTFSCGTCDSTQSCNAGVCEDLPPVPGCPGTGDCFVATGEIGCYNPTCCGVVCSDDPFCCSTSWDSTCAEEALSMCEQTCGDGLCDSGAGEHCGTCAADCGCSGVLECVGGSCVTCVKAEVCGSLECGPAQCGSLSFDCGSCAGGLYCTNGACTDFQPGPGCPGAGSCFSSNGSPGCTDAVCCTEVCSFDSFCCATSWDSLCASAAADVCN